MPGGNQQRQQKRGWRMKTQMYPKNGVIRHSERGEITFGPALLVEFEGQAIVFAHCKDEKGTHYIVIPGARIAEEGGQILTKPLSQEEKGRFTPTIFFNPQNPKNGLVHFWH